MLGNKLAKFPKTCLSSIQSYTKDVFHRKQVARMRIEHGQIFQDDRNFSEVLMAKVARLAKKPAVLATFVVRLATFS